MSNAKIVIASLPMGGLSASDAASRFTRSLRSAHPTIDATSFVQLPLVEGGEGTIDILVTNTLGSFLEVEATGATGEQLVVPLGFAAEDNKLAIIEMQRVAGSRDGQGSTYGVGELILDALDEGAFSVLLGHEEPLACDAGFGAAQAFGVKFFDARDKELDMRSDALSSVARIDPSGRAFQLLSSRFFVAQTALSAKSAASPTLCEELTRLSEIIRRDVGVVTLPIGRTASAVEFGLEAFISAKVQDGMSLVIEASGVQSEIEKGHVRALVLLAESANDLEEPAVMALLTAAAGTVKSVSAILRTAPTTAEKKRLKAQLFSFAEAKVFAAPLASDANQETVRRDTFMRLEKLGAQISI